MRKGEAFGWWRLEVGGKVEDGKMGRYKERSCEDRACGRWRLEGGLRPVGG